MRFLFFFFFFFPLFSSLSSLSSLSPLSPLSSLSPFLSFSLLSRNSQVFRAFESRNQDHGCPSTAPQDGRGASAAALTSAGTACRMAAPVIRGFDAQGCQTHKLPAFHCGECAERAVVRRRCRDLRTRLGSDRIERQGGAGDSR